MLKLKPKPKLKLKLKLLLNLVLVPLLLLLLMPLLMHLPVLVHNILLSKSLMEVLLLMFSSKEMDKPARLDKLPLFNIPVLSLLTVRSSIHQSQEVSQFHSLSVI